MLPTTELTYLALTAILTGALWIPYFVCQVMTNGFLAGENYTDPSHDPYHYGASGPTGCISMPLRALPRSLR